MHSTGQLTHARSSDGPPEFEGDLRVVVKKKILHHHQLYINLPDPISFLSITVDTSGHIYDDFRRLSFLHDHRETSVLSNEIPVRNLCTFIFKFVYFCLL